MNNLTEAFLDAARDYTYLLEKGYAQKSVLKLVGDHYQLLSVDRSMLSRGVDTPERSAYRRRKALDTLPSGSYLMIDGYNVIRTMGSYLLGRSVFVSTDGYLRDASEMHRSVLKTNVLWQTLQLLFEFLVEKNSAAVTIYLDEPVSNSGELAAEMNGLILQHGLKGKALTVRSPDHLLSKESEGIVCTADSAIIDSCGAAVFDLARSILAERFQPGFIILTPSDREDRS